MYAYPTMVHIHVDAIYDDLYNHLVPNKALSVEDPHL